MGSGIQVDRPAGPVRKIGVVGPGIVGMPMAALFAQARIREGTDRPATVMVVQRPSATSGWKVGAVNAGRSPIGGVEPELDAIVRDTVAAGLLRATHDVGQLADADLVVVAAQTDRTGWAPDYAPLNEALRGVAAAIRRRSAEWPVLVVIESTLAPSSMATVVRDIFAAQGLLEGREVLLGNSPNRVMPGRLVERVRTSDKLIGGLSPGTSQAIARVYRHIVTSARLLEVNSLTAEIVKTLENAHRDVRIAFAAELARACDALDVDFFSLRDELNCRLSEPDDVGQDGAAVPTGGILVPTIGVGGHCLPKDGILLRWRLSEAGVPAESSLILRARRINDASPAYVHQRASRLFGPHTGRRVTVLGAAYRPDSEDTRNSPALALAELLLADGADVRIHDPYVRPADPNLVQRGLTERFTSDLVAALDHAEWVYLCVAHRAYREDAIPRLRTLGPRVRVVVDACHVAAPADLFIRGRGYLGLGRGTRPPTEELIQWAQNGFVGMSVGIANELQHIVKFYNDRFAVSPFERVDLMEVRELAASCPTGCRIPPPGKVTPVAAYRGHRLSMGEPPLLSDIEPVPTVLA